MARNTDSSERKQGASFQTVIRSRPETDPDDPLELTRKGEWSKNQISDPYAKTGNGNGGHNDIITPPYNPAALLRLVVENSVLKQCVETMVTNVPGHGHRLEYVGPENSKKSAEAKAEAEQINAFLDHPNEDHSVTELRRRVRWDLEATGNAYIEVARNMAGDVTAFWHMPAHLMRLTEQDKEPTQIEVDLPRFGKRATQKVQKTFRRFIQRRGTKKVYFKEWGDPRRIDPENGKEAESLSHEDSATEVIHLTLYHAGSAYGVPRWINNVVAIQGSRQAELTNLDYFSDNAIPAMVVAVSGGSVTQESLNSVENHFTRVRGRTAQNRLVFLEAYGDENAVDEKGNIPAPKVEIKPLTDSRPSDGLFLEYDKAQTDKVRSSFRLPPIFLGLSQDYTHATANTSYDVAEGQVFGPERVMEDDVINRKILGGYKLKYWEVRSNPPRITDPEEVMKAIETFDAVGAMTPNIAIGLANEHFDMDIETINEEWGNFPFPVVSEAAKQGKVKGWEDIIEKVDPANMPGALNDPNAPPQGNEPVDPDDGDDKNQKTARVVRRAMMDLRDAMGLAKSADERERINASVPQRPAPKQAA